MTANSVTPATAESIQSGTGPVIGIDAIQRKPTSAMPRHASSCIAAHASTSASRNRHSTRAEHCARQGGSVEMRIVTMAAFGCNLARAPVEIVIDTYRRKQ